ncbi:diacylglycerol/polyprenol kinase family protein [Gaoshiqia sp. Z1-71]|uniref:diacylglycerol/polyprenol kinase family protein n=1 Tax=Gaoshiqia hydrogeniformans TaxID=3290090 RepID=UPI003BF86C9F
MVNTIVFAFVYLIGIAILLIFNELNYRRLNVKGEITRKFAHFTGTLATIPFPYIFSSHWYVMILAAIFFAVLLATQYSKQLKSIHDIERKSIGSYLLPFSIYITFLISTLFENKFLYILPMLLLAVCDPMAAILGMSAKKNNGKIKLFGVKTEKTIIGSVAFLVTGFVISIIALYFHRAVFDLKTFWLALLVAVTGTLAEIAGWRGSDNLSIPLSVVIILALFL